MAITLIVEDGTGVADANTYVSIAEAKTYASNRGFVLSATDDVIAAALIRACDYLETFRSQYKGSKTANSNYLQWPRKDVYVDGEYLADNHIPREIKNAQCELVISQNEGAVVLPTGGATSTGIIEETIGPITTKYSEGSTDSGKASYVAVSALLEPFIKNSFGLTVGRA